MNLQLFAYDPYSIVDYLKQNGQDSSYSARQKLAQDLGITGYKGTGEQNTSMLNTLKNGTASSGNSNNGTKVADTSSSGGGGRSKELKDKAGTPTAKNTTAPATSNISGVDKSVADKMASTFAPSGNVAEAKTNAQGALNTLTGMSAPSVSAETMQALNTPFTASSAYMEAMNYTNSLLEKLSSGRTSYTDQIKGMMNKIQNREKFSYDVDTDTLFQQALASAMGSGQQAMQDTMGQASALTGGYASTYAQSAGNQAYNAYIQDAYNNLPEYYQMAMDAYNMEGQEMYNQLSMLNDADANEYQRMYDSWNTNFTNAQQMYAQEYGAWQDSVNNAYNSANLQLNQQGMAYDQAYNTYGALSDYANTQYAQEYGAWQDKVNNAFNMAGIQNADYWNTQNFNEEQRQYDTDNTYRYDVMANDNYWNGVDNTYRYDALNQDQSQFEANLAHDDKWNQANLDHDDKWNQKELDFEGEWNQKELDYKKDALTQDDKWSEKDYLARYDINGDGKVDAEDKKVTDAEAEEEGYKTPSPETYDKAVEAYNTGGEAGLMAFLEKYPDYDVTALYDYALDHGTLAPEASTFTKVNDTVNGLWGIDHNDVVVDVNTGIEYKVSDLPKDMQKQLTDLKEGETFDFATGKIVKEEEEEGKNKLVRPKYGNTGKYLPYTTASLK